MQRQPVDATVPDSLRRVFAVPALAHAMTDSAPPDPSRTAQDPTAAAELEQMFVAIEAQTRAAESGKPVTDWAALNSRGKARRERVRALLGQDQLSTARDYYHAATIMQRGTEPDDYLMAHDLAVAAIINGEARAALVAAGSLDSFLKRTGRPQRYATQVEVTNLGTPQLYPIEPSVPDFLRVQFGAPTLATAEKYVAKLLEGYKKRKVGLVPE